MFGKIFFSLLFIILTALFSGFPVLGASAVAFLSSFESFTMRIFGTKWMVADICLLLFLSACLFRLWMIPRRNKIWRLPFIIIALTAFISCFFCINPFDSFHALLRLLFYLSGGYFIGEYLQGKKEYPFFRVSFSISLGVTMVLCLLYFMKLDTGDLIHLQGGFIDWNYFPIFLVCLLPFLLWEAQKAQTPMAEYVSLSIFILLVAAAYLSGSRMGIMLIVVLFFLCAVSGLLRKKYIHWLLPVIIIGIIHGVQSHSGIFNQFHLWLESPRLQERIAHGLYALSVFGDHPFFGAGYGQLEAYLNWAYPNLNYSASSVDASLFIFFAETGLLGGLAFSGLFIQLFCSFSIQDYSDNEEILFIRAIQISCILLGLSAFLYTIHYHLFTWCWIGILYGISKKQETTHS